MDKTYFLKSMIGIALSNWCGSSALNVADTRSYAGDAESRATRPDHTAARAAAHSSQHRERVVKARTTRADTSRSWADERPPVKPGESVDPALELASV